MTVKRHKKNDISFKKAYGKNQFYGGQISYYNVFHSDIRIGIIMHNKHLEPRIKKENERWIVRIITNGVAYHFQFDKLINAKKFFKKYYDVNNLSFNISQIKEDMRNNILSPTAYYTIPYFY